MDLNNPNIPIIGQTRGEAPPNAPGLTARIEIHDSEIIEIERVTGILSERSQSKVNYDAFDREIKERFQDIGFIVQVAWWHTDMEGVKMPEICISDRIERREFDHDRQVNEVTNDILGLGDAGVIKSDPAAMKALGQHGGHQH